MTFKQFEQWADQTFGSDFKEEETLTYFRMSAAWDAATEAEREACAKKLPDVLFDGYAVMQQLDKRGQARNSQENVSDVLDAVVRIMRSTAELRPTCAASSRKVAP
jgi:hypothetical protein